MEKAGGLRWTNTQWTHASYGMAREKKKKIGNLSVQLEHTCIFKCNLFSPSLNLL